MWSPDGTIEDLGNLPGQSGGWATAINDSGVVVGSNGDDAFVWTRADGMRRLADFGFNAHRDQGDERRLGDGLGRARARTRRRRWSGTRRVASTTSTGWSTRSRSTRSRAMGLNDQHQLLVYGYTEDGNGGLEAAAAPRAAVARCSTAATTRRVAPAGRPALGETRWSDVRAERSSTPPGCAPTLGT